MKNVHTLLNILTFVVLFEIFCFSKPRSVSAVDCSGITTSGNYTVSSTCAFPGTVNGVDAGSGTTNTAVLTIGAGGTLSVLSGQTLAVGSLVMSGGSMALIGTATVKLNTPLYLPDADSDTYPTAVTTTQYTSAATGRARRNLSLDYNDNNASIYPGTTCNGVCSVNNADGTCGPVSAGKNGLGTCQYCNGSSLSASYISEGSDTYGECSQTYSCSGYTTRLRTMCNGGGSCAAIDSAASDCSGTCASYCSSGSCIATNTGAGTCNTEGSVRVASGGNGHCTSSSCIADCTANGYACSSNGACCSGICRTDNDGDGFLVGTTGTCRASDSSCPDGNDSQSCAAGANPAGTCDYCYCGAITYQSNGSDNFNECATGSYGCAYGYCNGGGNCLTVDSGSQAGCPVCQECVYRSATGACGNVAAYTDPYNNCAEQTHLTVSNYGTVQTCTQRCAANLCPSGNCNGTGGCGTGGWCTCKGVGTDSSNGQYAYYSGGVCYYSGLGEASCS